MSIDEFECLDKCYDLGSEMSRSNILEICFTFFDGGRSYLAQRLLKDCR